jgi:hypothetical protein
MNKDENELNLLSIFHFVMAGLGAIGGCVPVIYLLIGIMMIRDPRGLVGPGGPPVNPGWFFIVFGGVFMLVIWTVALCLLISGMSLRARQRYWFCFVISCIICLNMPLGTALGVFTLIVLSRASVKQIFGVAPS